MYERRRLTTIINTAATAAGVPSVTMLMAVGTLKSQRNSKMVMEDYEKYTAAAKINSMRVKNEH